MERADLLTANGAIFTVQGKAIAENARKASGSGGRQPCNTNAYIAAAAAGEGGPHQPNNYPACCAWTTTAPSSSPPRPAARFPLKKLVVWGNHSPTMYADYRNCTSNGDNVKALINDSAWNNDVFLPTVGKRGAAIIEARGLSSAASAANAAIDHVRDWVLGSDERVTMGVYLRRFLWHPGR